MTLGVLTCVASSLLVWLSRQRCSHWAARRLQLGVGIVTDTEQGTVATLLVPTTANLVLPTTVCLRRLLSTTSVGLAWLGRAVLGLARRAPLVVRPSTVRASPESRHRGRFNRQVAGTMWVLRISAIRYRLQPHKPVLGRQSSAPCRFPKLASEIPGEWVAGSFGKNGDLITPVPSKSVNPYPPKICVPLSPSFKARDCSAKGHAATAAPFTQGSFTSAHD